MNETPNVLSADDHALRYLIQEHALRNGFKTRQQDDGSKDLNPYVYDFARELLVTTLEDALERIRTADSMMDRVPTKWITDDLERAANNIRTMTEGAQA